MFLIPFCYFSYRRSLIGVPLPLVALVTSMALVRVWWRAAINDWMAQQGHGALTSDKAQAVMPVRRNADGIIVKEVR